MDFFHPGAGVFVPDGQNETHAFGRTTHLGIGAHADDLEIMAFHGIKNCYEQEHKWFGGVTCTNGSGSPRTGPFASWSDEWMQELRRKEQEQAAELGKYSFVAQLDFPSAQIKEPGHQGLKKDLAKLISATRPDILYTHNPADKHETHIAVFVAVIRAIRQLPVEERPANVYGCEVWRDLDWMQDEDKVALDVSDSTGLGMKLVNTFTSQISGGKHFGEATFGRRRANATFYRSHEVDDASQIVFAMDLTPLTKDDSLDILEFVNAHVRRFQNDVQAGLKKMLGGSGL